MWRKKPEAEIIQEAKKKAEAEVSKIISQAEQKGLQLIDEAKKKANAETSKALKEAEQNAPKAHRGGKEKG